MSIIGLSEKLRLPRKGKIRLGEKKMSEKGKLYPSALDYFVVPEEVKEVYPGKPRKLDIMFPMENRDDFFPQWYKRYGSSKGLICKGDGKTATEIPEGTGFLKNGKVVDEKGEPKDLDNFQMKEIDCEGKECPYYQERDCKQVGNLQVILPKVKGLGVYQIDTSSYNSILNINSGIELIRGMLERVARNLNKILGSEETKIVGRISWIPLVLEVKMQEAHPVVKGKRIKTIVPVMSVDLEMSVESMMAMLKSSALPAPTAEIDNPKLHDKPTLLFPKKDGSVPTDEEEKETKEKTGLETKEDTEEKAAIDIPGETEVKDDQLLSEEEARKEQNELLEEEESEGKEGRNQLNIRWHVLKKKCLEVGIFVDEGSYRAWIEEEFGEGKRSSKDLDKNNMIWGIEVMAEKYNKHSEKGKEQANEQLLL